MSSQWRILFSGHVQGVGFRYRTHRIAGAFDLTGHVRNLPDGKVEVVCEGNPNKLDCFVQEIQQEMGSYIRDTAIQQSPSSGGMTGFTVRY